LADESSSRLQTSLTAVSRTAAALTPAAILVPPELLAYVEGGRNPDIYTREFVELARRGNQLMRGKRDAFAAFRDVLAEETRRGLPELGEDVARVLAATSRSAEDGRRSHAWGQTDEEPEAERAQKQD
jgi:mediator of RNA polymerase II transcription subunit 10